MNPKNAINEMRRLNILIMGISEMRWPGSGLCNVDDHGVHYSGEDSNCHRNGVGFIVTRKDIKYVRAVTQISDIVIRIQLNAKRRHINLIHVYTRIAESELEEVEKFYTDDQRQLKTRDFIILMGVLNTKIGKGRQSDVIADFGNGNTNERETILTLFLGPMCYLSTLCSWTK